MGRHESLTNEVVLEHAITKMREVKDGTSDRMTGVWLRRSEVLALLARLETLGGRASKRA